MEEIGKFSKLRNINFNTSDVLALKKDQYSKFGAEACVFILY